MTDTTETPTITPEQVAEFQRIQAEAERKYIMDAAQKIMDFATSLGVTIVAVPKLVSNRDGIFGVICELSVQRTPK